jgi:hypothetical protein
MTVSRHDRCLRGRAKRHEVVVAGVGRTREGRVWRISGHARLTAKKLDQLMSLRRRDALAKLRRRQRAIKLGEQRIRCDELEGSVEPHAQDLGWGASRREQRGNENVGVENRPHRSVLAVSSRVLGFDGKLERLALTEIVPSPQPIEEVEAKVSSKGFLDDLAIGLPRARSPHLHGAQHILVDRQRRTRLYHLRIIAS